MAFVKLNEVTAKALEKGLASTIKAADLRWYDYGPDLKKATAGDNICVGPVAYVTLTDPKNTDTALAAAGSITKLFYLCNSVNAAQRYAVMENVDNGDAVNAAKAWVEAQSMALTALVAKCPSVA